jgi:hypothetical protein
LTAGVVLLAGVLIASGFALRGRHHGGASAAAGTTSGGTTTSSCEFRVTKHDLPKWFTRRLATVLVDSVLLGGVSALRETMKQWRLSVVGRPAIMVKLLDAELTQSGQHVAPLVIAGIGYNSLWERDRKNYQLWAAEFDRRAQHLLGTLKRAGAQQFAWVTLRHARRSVIPSNSLWQYRDYAWYFGYVNERLSVLDHKRDDLVRANWASVSNRPGITYDAIHLNPQGAALMARTIQSAVKDEAARQARATAKAAAC